MAIECFDTECPKHSCNYPEGHPWKNDGPFCDETECIKIKEERVKELELRKRAMSRCKQKWEDLSGHKKLLR